MLGGTLVRFLERGGGGGGRGRTKRGGPSGSPTLMTVCSWAESEEPEIATPSCRVLAMGVPSPAGSGVVVGGGVRRGGGLTQ